MEKIKVAQTFQWEMGHRLPYHSGGCENIHGHSYKLIVEVEGTVQENGMVMDFFDLKAIVQPVVQELDHCFLCSRNDDIMHIFLKGTDFKVKYVDFYSTVENIGLYFLNILKSHLQRYENLTAVHLRIFETPAEYAEMSAGLHR